MILRRTSNAGMLIEIDGISVLADGVAEELPPYEGTPRAIREELMAKLPDYVLFTHNHKDHYDVDFAGYYSLVTGKRVYMAEETMYQKSGNTEIFSVSTRHIGKTDVSHVSYVINGSKCIWFMGDASPLELKKLQSFPAPDVLIVPYAYTVTESAWKSTLSTDADKIILLHMPMKENDIHNLWTMTEEVTRNDNRLIIPGTGHIIKM